MYCSRCGKEVPDNLDRCPFCSETVLLVNGPVPAGVPSDLESTTIDFSLLDVESRPPMPRQALWKLIVLIFITGGIYEAFWYKKVSRFLNALAGEERFGKGPYWFFLAGFSMYFVMSMVKGSYEAVGMDTEGIKLISGAIWLTTTSFLILVCFRMMDTLKDLHERKGLPFSSSRLYAVILNVLYVQKKINRM